MNQLGSSGPVSASPAFVAGAAAEATEGATPDPQWAYTLAIRSALELHGRFETELDERDAQSVVDLHWAARQAGRLLGVRVRVVVGGPVARTEYVVAATVLAVDQDGGGRARAELGLRQLLCSVRAAQGPARPVEVAVN